MQSMASWSGGKDSCLALWRAQKSGANVTHLLTAMDETGQKTRSHGVPKDFNRPLHKAIP
jgi:diphthamide synthase (EF-2-diphthine--ammonia ligase)